MNNNNVVHLLTDWTQVDTVDEVGSIQTDWVAGSDQWPRVIHRAGGVDGVVYRQLVVGTEPGAAVFVDRVELDQLLPTPGDVEHEVNRPVRVLAVD